MPESLHWNRAVKGALVVVGGRVRVSDLPEIDRRARYAPSEAEQLRMRASLAAGKICERDLDDAESVRVRLDQDFLEHLEVGAAKIEVGECVASLKAVATGEVPHRHREHPPEHAVQEPTGRAAHEGGVGDAAASVPRGDHDVAALARPPHLGDKIGIVRLVGVESQYVIAARLGKAGLERTRVSFAALRHDSGAQRLRGLASSVGRAAVDYNDLVDQPIAVEQRI